MDMPTYEDLFKTLKINFWLIGVPYGNIKISFRYYFSYISLLIMILAESSFIISKMSEVNLIEITQLVPCTCIGILSTLKIVAITMKRKKIFELADRLGRLYRNIETNQEKTALVKTDMILLKKLSQYFFILNLVLISVYNFASPVIILYNYLKFGEISYVLPYAVLLPFEVNSWLRWALVYVHSISCGFICVLYFTTIDVLYCVLTTHICSNFAVISNKIQQLDKTNVHLLKEIIKDHQYILQMSEDLEDIFTAPNLFNVIVGSVEICALGFNLTMGEVKQIPGCILFLVSVLLQILMMSVFGENIITESSKIGEAAYTCKWYEMDNKSKKIILILMIRTRKPVRLTAHKFSVISYGSFCKILSTSWSYFTILRTVYTPADSVK